jgi:plastocyanin
MRKPLTVIAVAAIGIAPAGAASGAHLRAAGKTKTVKVSDDFFAPTKITVKKGTTIKWVWRNADTGGATTDNTHTVTDAKGNFTSAETDTGTYKHKFKKTGKFTILCAVHDEMTMKVNVKK